MGVYETSTELKKIGIITGKDLTTEAAITKLMYQLGKNIEPKTFNINYEENICGELTEK